MTIEALGALFQAAPQRAADADEALASSGGAARFQEALNLAQNRPDQTRFDDANAVQIAQTGPLDPSVLPPVNSTGQAQPGDISRERAFNTLEAGRAAAPSGEAILSGLERLRTVFDSQIGAVAAQSEGARMDVASMMALQAEVVKYSVLVDVSSKLAGKSTQAMDSLMKGQ